MINYLIYSNVGWPQFEADPTNAEGQKKKKSKSTKIMVNGNSHKKQMTFITIVYH